MKDCASGTINSVEGSVRGIQLGPLPAVCLRLLLQSVLEAGDAEAVQQPLSFPEPPALAEPPAACMEVKTIGVLPSPDGGVSTAVCEVAFPTLWLDQHFTHAHVLGVWGS